MKVSLIKTFTIFLTVLLFSVPALSQDENEHLATVKENGGWGLSMGLQNDLPVFAYYNSDGDLEFSSWDLQELDWNREVVHVGVDLTPNSSSRRAETSIVVANGGQVHIFYTDDEADRLWHAWQTGSGWEREAITAAGSGGDQPQAARCNSGFCVCYYNRNEQNLWVAEGVTDSWTTTRIEPIGAEAGRYCDIEQLPSGNPAIASYDSANGVLKYTEKFNGEWDQPFSLGSPEANEWGLYPDLVINPDGDPEIYYFRTSGSSSDGSVSMKARESGVWNTYGIEGPHAGAYPSFIHRSNGLVIGIYRRLMYSGLFGNAGNVVRYEEIPGYNPLRGRATINTYSCVARFEHMKILEASDGSLFMAAFDPFGCFDTPANIKLLSRMEAGTPPGQEPFELRVIVEDEDAAPISGARVQLEFEGETRSVRTGEDGRATFSALRGMGAFTVSTSKAGYAFDDLTGTMSFDQSRRITGETRPILLSGIVVDDEESPLTTPTLTVNGSTEVAIDPVSGEFSIPVEYGESYTLSIEDEFRIFLNPDVSGKIYGDVQHRFVGYPK